MRRSVIDSHLHLWRLGTGWYGWNTPDLGAVHADSGLAEIAPSMAAAGVSGAVVVQAADVVEETTWLVDLVRREPRLLGVVGYLPLTDPDALARWLATNAGAPLVGVRQLWHDHEEPGILADASVRGCLEVLGERGLPVDVPDAFPRLWPALRSAVDRSPGTTFVLDHCGKPPFGDARGWREWEAGFIDLAGRPNVVIKLSGLFGGSGSARPATPDELARVVDLTRTYAGADRTLVGSDWPLTRGRVDYLTTITRLLDLLSSWSSAEVIAATTATARRVYGL